MGNMYTEHQGQEPIYSTALPGSQSASVYFNYARLVMSLGLALGDYSGLLLSGLGAVAIRHLLIDGDRFPVNRIPWILMMAGLGVLLYGARQLYPSIGLGW